ncbi:MAG TPA: hypothetical protein VL424_08690 [Pararobbsia sp.]|nr:hypothetical protein [Pararobbsia sp.]
MKQTVVGVFETSEEARRAQAALLDAQFAVSSVRMSMSGTLRGVDEGMAYPVGAPRGLEARDATGAPDALDASARDRLSERERLTRARRKEHGHEHALDRVTEFFRGLFSPESQREELSRYEEALRRGGALVAVDVEDEIEQSLASDILIRAGAYDLEERSSQWDESATSSDEASLDPVPGSVQTRPVRSAAMPGNVTSMDPGDATGYRASRTDFSTGETWPATRTALGESSDSGARGMRDPVRHEDLTHTPVGTGMASWDRLEGDYGVEGDFGSERVRVTSQNMQHSAVQSAVRTEYLQEHAMRNASMRDGSGNDRAQPEWHKSPEAHAWLEGPDDERRHRAEHEGDDADLGNEVVSSDEARHLLASGCEVFLDDCGFARMRNRGRVQPIQRDGPTKISRNVRVYARRADDPQAQRAARMSDDSFSHRDSGASRSAADGEGGRMAQPARMEQRERANDMRSAASPSSRAMTRDDETMTARDRRMMRASLRARDCDDERELDPFTSDAQERVARGRSDASSLSRDPASGDWAAEWAAEKRAALDESYSPGPDDLEADRIGDDAAGRSAAAMTGQPMPASGRRPTGAEDLARREAALREQTLSDYGDGDRAQQLRHPEWRDRAEGDPLERAAELARREATLRDQTLQDYAAMDERAEMRAANAAAAARASSHAAMTGDAAHVGVGSASAVASASTNPKADVSDMSKDLRAEGGLHSPLADRFGTRRTALDDGAPLRDTYDDDDRRYSAQDDAYPTDEAFVDTRDPSQRSTRTASEWNHMKTAVRNAWHKMTHPGRHH